MSEKVYVDGVPFKEIPLTNGERVRLYDTSGPGSDPAHGLPPLRSKWIEERGDVETYVGRAASTRDDGRAAVRRGGDAAGGPWAGEGRAPLRGGAGGRGTQQHHARRGAGTRGGAVVAAREGL